MIDWVQGDHNTFSDHVIVIFWPYTFHYQVKIEFILLSLLTALTRLSWEGRCVSIQSTYSVYIGIVKKPSDVLQY